MSSQRREGFAHFARHGPLSRGAHGRAAIDTRANVGGKQAWSLSCSTQTIRVDTFYVAVLKAVQNIRFICVSMPLCRVRFSMLQNQKKK